jgi:hypothetical protein
MDIQAWSTYTTRWKLVSPGFDVRTLKIDEFNAAKEMQHWWSTRGGVAGAKGDIIKRDNTGQTTEEGPTKSKKSGYIASMETDKFYDIVAEVNTHFFANDGHGLIQVVKSYPGRPHTLYVTDYTQNTALHSYAWSAQKNDWKGPFGKYTLQISCWFNDDQQVRANIKVGEIYLFRNVRAKRYPHVLPHIKR